MRVRKMDYINYGMEVLKWKRQFHCQTSSVSNHLYQWWKENKLNKIDSFSERKTRKGDLGLIEVKDFISLRQ
jgi:hypothetical protein